MKKQSKKPLYRFLIATSVQFCIIIQKSPVCVCVCVSMSVSVSTVFPSLFILSAPYPLSYYF